MNDKYRQARFLVSAADLRGMPADQGRETAFAGRSNAGKSSALNALTGQGALARTSKTPGRTQLVNFFALDDNRRLVDLPGYGYAKVPPPVRARWQRLISGYLQRRRSLCGLVLLMDVRHPLTDPDLQLIDWTLAAGLPLHCLLTKADKLKRGAATNQLLAVRRALRARAPEAGVQLFSSLKNNGIEELRACLDAWLEA